MKTSRLLRVSLLILCCLGLVHCHGDSPTAASDPNQPATFILDLKLTGTCSAVGIAVFIDGQVVGRAFMGPNRFTVAPGTHRFALLSPETSTSFDTFVVSPGGTVSVVIGFSSVGDVNCG